MSKNTREQNLETLDAKLRSLSMGGPDASLRHKVLDESRRRLARRTDLIHVEPTLQVWSFDSLLAAAVLLLALAVPTLLAPQVPYETPTPSPERSELARALGSETLGQIGSHAGAARAHASNRELAGGLDL